MKDLLCIVPPQKRLYRFFILLGAHCMDMIQVRTGKNILWLLFSLAHFEVIVAALTEAKQDHMSDPHLGDYHSYRLEDFNL